MVRAPFFDKNGVKKGAWSREEDEKLRAYVEKYGHWNWRELPKFAGLSRCGKSCRLRWMNYLRPGVKHGDYSKQEEDLIIKLHEQFGNKWSKIAAKLPGRTDNEIKNYWHTHIKKVTKQSQCQSIEQLTETYQFEDMTENRDTKVESFAKQTSLPILESCPLSPESTSSELTHLTSPDSSLATSCNWPCVAVDSHSSFETSEDTSGDFWTQPFVADQDGYKLPALEGGNYYISPDFTYYEDSTDLFYQVMQEFSGN